MKQPILALAPNDWDGPRMNRQHLLSGLARRGWPILYSTGAPHFWSRGTREWHRLPLVGAVTEREGVMVDRPSRLLMRRDKSKAWDRLVIRVHLRRLLRTLAASPDSVICHVFHPSFWPYVELLRPARVAYHVYDAFHLTDDWNSVQEEWQAELVKAASLLIATSLPMAESFPKVEREVKELPNAVDYDRFALARVPECPAEMREIPRPRIMHPGVVNEKIDLQLILQLAKARPEWHWVVLGRLSAETQAGGKLARVWSECLSLPNVHYLGVKPHEALPAYLHNGDVSAMCYRTDGGGWWERVYPLRLHELLAVGRPIVASRLGVFEPFSHVLALPVGFSAWTEALTNAINVGGVGSVEQRRREASQNTWDHRVSQLERWLTDL